MQQSASFLGIDISKLTLDIYVWEEHTKSHFRIPNEVEAINAFIVPLLRKDKELHIGMENTGCYNYHIYEAFNALGLNYYVIPPLHLKKSIGLSRGKNDKIDAARIALFLKTNISLLTSYRPAQPVVQALQQLLTLRGQRVKLRKQILVAEEPLSFCGPENAAWILAQDQELIKHVDDQIKGIEIRIQSLINENESLSVVYKLISSVQGVGKVLSWNLIVSTGCFINIDNARKMACYAGVVPFEHSSGTSVRGRTRVSCFADKSMKTLLHMAAMRATRLEGDLRDYYLRKVEEGKNKMSVINAIRNKILHRVYAVLKHQRPYQKYAPQNLATS